MTPAPAPPEIFDRAARRLRRDRAARLAGADDFVGRWMAEGLADRLATVTRGFSRILAIGVAPGSIAWPVDARVVSLDASFVRARAARAAGAPAVQGDEDRLPFADASFDLIVSAGGLDQLADLPGALVLARRALRPDGLLLASFLGAGSLPALRAAMAAGDGDRAAPRLHPQIDVRAAGDLLARAGFALPVADVETLDARYPALDRLLADLRAMAATNLLAARMPLARAALDRARARFGALADADGRTRERFAAIVLTGWAPDPSQPRPARRGSAGASLADALRPPG